MMFLYFQVILSVFLSGLVVPADNFSSSLKPTKSDDAPAEPDRLQILFAGDVMGHGPQISAAQIVENLHYDYTSCFEYIKPLIQSNDIAVANLEVTLPGRPPYSGYPLFKSPDALALALREAGFDVMLTANNHSNDAGQAGVFETINTLYKYGFYQTGSFQSQEEKDAYYPLIIHRKGFRIALLNYTYSTNGIANSPPTIVNVIDERAIQLDLKEAKLLSPDFIIVAMHWGDEYRLQENRRQQELARRVIGWGADLIVGAHPHVVQPMKLLAVDSVKAVPVAYSLGNFISNQQHRYTDGGVLLEVQLEKNRRDSKAFISGMNYIPVWRWKRRGPGGTPRFTVVPISIFESDDDYRKALGVSAQKKMNNFATFIRKHLASSDVDERKLKDVYSGK